MLNFPFPSPRDENRPREIFGGGPRAEFRGTEIAGLRGMRGRFARRKRRVQMPDFFISIIPRLSLGLLLFFKCGSRDEMKRRQLQSEEWKSNRLSSELAIGNSHRPFEAKL